MILNEYLGNLNKISPRVWDLIKDNIKYDDTSPNSEIKIIPYNDFKTFFETNKPEDIAWIILRYGNEDLIIFQRYISEYYDFITHENFKNNKLFQGTYYFKDLYLNIISFIENSKNTNPNKFNLQVIYIDKNKKNIRNQRYENEKGYEKIERHTNKRVINNRVEKIHGSLANRYSEAQMKVNLFNRLQTYIENKLPSFDNINDFEKAFKGTSSKLKGFKIKDNIYRYDLISSQEANNDTETGAYFLKYNKFYISYRIENPSNCEEKGLPYAIAFEFSVKNNEIYISNILIKERLMKFIPLSQWINNTQPKNKSEKKFNDNDW